MEASKREGPPKVFLQLMHNLDKMAWGGGWVLPTEMVGADFPKPYRSLLRYLNDLLDPSAMSDAQFLQICQRHAPGFFYGMDDHARAVMQLVRDTLATKVQGNA